MEVAPSIFRRFRGLLLLLPLVLNSNRTPGQVPPPAAQKTDKLAQTPPQRPPRVIADLRQFHLDQRPSPNMKNQVGAATRGSAQSLTLCAPALGVAYSVRPLFQWRTLDGSKATVNFSLLNDAGDVLYENDVTGFSFEYPADAPALKPGQTYSWKVSGGDMNRLPEPVSIQLQDKPERDALDAMLVSNGPVPDPLVHAQIFLKSGVWYDAVATLRAAIKQNPERKDLQEQLTQTYQQVIPACGAP